MATPLIKRLKIRQELREKFMNFTGENYEVAEHFMDNLDEVREDFNYIKSGDSDCTGETSEKLIAEFIKYMLL